MAGAKSNHADIIKSFEQALDVAATYAKPIVHWGFIPAVIICGMLFTKPRPSIGQLFFMG